MLEANPELYICVDVEAAGPIPGDYSMLSIGACTIFEPQTTFYIELKPVNQLFTPEAAAVSQLSLQVLEARGEEPQRAIQKFETWLAGVTVANQKPILVAFNAPFDWMFVNYYFVHYLGHNPFGHAALDIKALYMGKAGVPWSQTSWRYIDPKYQTTESLTHHALQDALDQAALFRHILKEIPPGYLSIGADKS